MSKIINFNKLKRRNENSLYYECEDTNDQDQEHNTIAESYLPKRFRSFTNYKKNMLKNNTENNDDDINSNIHNSTKILTKEPTTDTNDEEPILNLTDTKINAIYLLLKKMNQQLIENKDEIKKLKSDIIQLVEQDIKLKELNDNINIIKNDTKEIRKELTTLESVVTNKQLHNENAILNNIKKLSINSEKAGKDECETTYDYRSSYIN